MDNVITPVQENATSTNVSGDVVPSPTQENLVSSSHIPRWSQILLSCIAVILVLSCAVWYGSKKYYQVKPLTVYLGESKDQNVLVEATSSLMQNQTSSTTENASSDYDLSSFTISEYSCYLDSITSQDNKLSTTTLSNLKDELCVNLKNQGKVSIKQPTKIIFNEKEALTVGVITSSGYTYLTYFSINDDGKGTYTLILNSANLLKISNVSKISQDTIKNIAGESVIVKVSGTDVSGIEIQQYFKKISVRHVGSSFIEIIRNSDGTFSDTISSASDYGVAKVLFLAPYSSYYTTILTADVDSFEDSSKNTITAYHKEVCGFEDGYSDMSFYIYDYNTTIGINFGFSSTLNITTTRTGYDPQQWGKILEKISMDDFRASIQKPKALNSNSPAEILTIGGYQVKHVGPVTHDRSCYPSDDKSTYDIYQAVKNGAVVTFEGTRDNVDETQKLISQVLTTLTFSKR
jgi:hypothetical protein